MSSHFTEDHHNHLDRERREETIAEKKEETRKKESGTESEHRHEHNHEHAGNGHKHDDKHHDSLNCNCEKCGHEHGCASENQESKMMTGRLIISAVMLAIGLFFPEKNAGRFILSLISALVIGYDVIGAAVRNLLHRELLDEMFLMSIAFAGAFVLGEYTEGALVLLLFQLGEFLQDQAVDRSRESISELMEIRPETATVIRDGKETNVSPEEVQIKEILVVRPGERIPLDGDIVEGESFLDTVALTGESVPRAVRTGDEVLSGCVNQKGVLHIRVKRPFGESAVSRILELVENATEHKSRADRFITRFARIYTPVVVCSAAALFLIAGLITGSWAEWLRRSLTFLVISCPCALVISVPLSYFNGIGRASRQGILVKGSNVLEELSRAGIVALDKTGTVTKGVFEVVAIHPEDMKEEELIRLTAAAEKYSKHPIAETIRNSCTDWETLEVRDCREEAGHGVITQVEGRRVAVGNNRLMAAEGAECHDCHISGTIAHVSVNGKYEGHLVIADIVKESAEEAVRKLKALGIRKIVMLTGDRKNAAEEIGKQIGADEIFAELKPEDKVSHIERLKAERNTKQETVLFVGDGINDAPVLVTADLGVAMGTAGADAAVEAADIVLIDDDPRKLADGIHLARRTQNIVKENIIFSILVKVLVMVFGAFGLVPLWLAVFSDVGVCLLAVFNAMR